MNGIETLGLIVSIVAALGVGGIAGAFVQSFLQQRRYVRTREQNFRQTRYLAILILMLTQLDVENGLDKIKKFRDDLKNIDDVKKEIETEYLNSFVFASDNVINSLGEFIKKPDKSSFISVAVAMRRDLWGKTTKITESALEGLNNKSNNTKKISEQKNDNDNLNYSQANKLLKFIAEGGVTGGAIAIWAIGLAAFMSGWWGMAVVMLLFGFLLWILGSMQMKAILNESGKKVRFVWERPILGVGILLVAFAIMGGIDLISTGTPKPNLDPYWWWEGVIGIPLLVLGILFLKVRISNARKK